MANEGPSESGQLLTTQFRSSLFKADKSGFPDFAAADSLKTQLDHKDGPRLFGQDRLTQARSPEVKLERTDSGVCANKTLGAVNTISNSASLKLELRLASNAPLRGKNTQARIRSEATGACVFLSQ